MGNGSTWRLGLRLPGTTRQLARVSVDHDPQVDETFRIRIRGDVVRVRIAASPRIVIHPDFDVIADEVKMVDNNEMP